MAQLIKGLASRATTTGTSVPELKNHTPEQQFTFFIQGLEREYRGRNGNGKPLPYAPYARLRGYWTPAKVDEVCNSYRPHLPSRYNAIKNHSLLIFSILVYISETHRFEAFVTNGITDEWLPLTEVPSALDAPIYEVLFRGSRKFLQEQWRFCPLLIDSARLLDRQLPPEQILPFANEELLKDGDWSQVYKIVVPSDCCGTEKVFDLRDSTSCQTTD